MSVQQQVNSDQTACRLQTSHTHVLKYAAENYTKVIIYHVVVTSKQHEIQLLELRGPQQCWKHQLGDPTRPALQLSWTQKGGRGRCRLAAPADL